MNFVKILKRDIFSAFQFYFFVLGPLQVSAKLSFGQFCGVFVTAASS